MTYLLPCFSGLMCVAHFFDIPYRRSVDLLVMPFADDVVGVGRLLTLDLRRTLPTNRPSRVPESRLYLYSLTGSPFTQKC